MSQKRDIYRESLRLKAMVIQYVRSQVKIWHEVQTLMLIEASFSKRTLIGEDVLMISIHPIVSVNLKTGDLVGLYGRPISTEAALFLAANREKIDARNHASKLRFTIKAWEKRNSRANSEQKG